MADLVIRECDTTQQTCLSSATILAEKLDLELASWSRMANEVEYSLTLKALMACIWKEAVR